ncbi:type II toxin-antitoxin system HipA family toxin [Maridesulfovibrio bastinii]|uniref:type II toxin-antitoxin system HipA family toxin n=1 Tax=Maridesulfovibrio bastinii TaxID=47157 RepID=UPI0003FF4C82|nr:type II toxin-antitoxin system HipA family toxin [Maridesulfovibrio bastinii]
MITEDVNSILSEFDYGRRYLERRDAIPLDPVQLPLIKDHFQTEGLFRVFHDASPDGWGSHLLDIAAGEFGKTPSLFDYLTVLDQKDRIGALAFGPDLYGPKPHCPEWRPKTIVGEHLDFEEMLSLVDEVLDDVVVKPQFRRFFIRGSSVGGAQPKAVVSYHGNPMIAKFSKELEHWPTCRIELAAMNLARMCGIRVPECEVIQIAGRDVFLIKRFDRGENGERFHFLSAMTLTSADNMEKGSYADIALAIRRYGVQQFLKKDLEELFRRMVFNIMINNHDDHLKNHGFLYDVETGGWRLSPAYDIVPQPQEFDTGKSYLKLSIGTQGRLATLNNALSQSENFGLKKEQAKEIIKFMGHIVLDNWEKENRRSGVPLEKIISLREAYRNAYNVKKIEI